MKKVWLLIIVVLLITSPIGLVSAQKTTDYEKFLTGDYWKQQAIKEIIPFWVPTIDPKGGGFFTDINQDGTVNSAPLKPLLKYPRMVSRAVYGFCSAYLLSGDEQYLSLAKHGLNYLQQYGWDKTYGGWYNELRNNTPTIPIKDLFSEAYGNLGPIFYYFVTGNNEALKLVEKTHTLMKEKAWDNEYKGYFNIVNRDWSVSQTDKSFNSQIDTASAYLFYYYLNTKDPKLLSDLKDIGNVIINHMYDPKSGYIRAHFSRTWDFLDSYLGPDQIDIGHNLKTTWILLRLYQLTEDERYFGYAQKLAAKLLETGWDKQYGGWYFSKRSHSPAQTASEKQKCWWTQTEGNFMLLNLYNLTGNQSYLDYYKKNTLFWDKYLIDHQSKEVFAYTAQNGAPQNGLKGDLYKSAYHSMEHALFNYLYLQLYVHKQPAELFFNLSASAEGIKHYVRIVENRNVIINQVEINGKSWQKFDTKEGFIILPKGNNMKVKVVFGTK